MATENCLTDNSGGKTLMAESNTVSGEMTRLKADPTTGSLKVTMSGGSVALDVTIGGVPEAYTGTLTAGVTTVSFSDTINSLRVDNLDTANTILYSVDQNTSGTTFLSLTPESSIDGNYEIAKIHLKCTAGATYQVEATVAST